MAVGADAEGEGMLMARFFKVPAAQGLIVGLLLGGVLLMLLEYTWPCGLYSRGNFYFVCESDNGIQSIDCKGTWSQPCPEGKACGCKPGTAPE